VAQESFTVYCQLPHIPGSGIVEDIQIHSALSERAIQPGPNIGTSEKVVVMFVPTSLCCHPSDIQYTTIWGNKDMFGPSKEVSAVQVQSSWHRILQSLHMPV
jgi:hypothetical protein